MPLDADAVPGLAEKVAFLSTPAALGASPDEIVIKETHMSWVFLTSDRAYKLKKPVRFPYLDFSTLQRREVAARAEVSLNRRLAPNVYFGVVPLVLGPQGLRFGGEGEVVDWLVAMRRLDDRWMIEQAILEGRLQRSQLDRLIARLAHFYARARPILIQSGALPEDWVKSIAVNRRVLMDRRLGLPQAAVGLADRAQRLFLAWRPDLLIERVRDGRIVDAHGDLRPEHISVNEDVVIIDCLEFNARLRSVDPFDEIAFLTLECERLGARWAGDYILSGLSRRMRDPIEPELYLFYRCYRATLRARLAIAHLLEPNPRTPEKWPKLAGTYIAMAERDAHLIERMLRKPRGRPDRAHRKGDGWSPRTTVQKQ